MDEDGLAGRGRDVELGDEGGLLGGDVGVFDVVVVEADFADGDAARIGGERREFGERFRGGPVRLLRMNADGRVRLREG